MRNSDKHVIVAMSGGVDSSVAALLLKQQGYQVSGLFMKNWEEDDTETYCAASKDIEDAQAICDKLEIELHRVNFAAEYWDEVFAHFLQEYRAGRTPNPDILCNREIKFKAFLDYAMQLNADYIATGHYARVAYVDEQYQLLTGIDANKDQSYFIYTLGQAQLAKTLFPIGDFTKPDIRELAKQHGFDNHDRKGSTGICFIGPKRFKEFLNQYLPAQPGNIETAEGKVIGKHDGLMFYTLGQRQGLGIGGLKDSDEAPWYVVDKDMQRNVLVVTQGLNHPLLFTPSLTCSQLHWVADIAPAMPLHCSAKIRYRQTSQLCTVTRSADDRYDVSFAEPQRAVTPGQSVVFYQNDVCLGGGVIDYKI